MKMTLLDMVQSILSDMNSDEVNSIGDTVESLQVANILKNTYSAMISTRNWAHVRETIELTGVADLDRPTHMKLPDNVKELCFINYNKQKEGETRLRFEEIKYIEPDSFLRKGNYLNSDKENVTTVQDNTGVTLLIQNDKNPTFYTSFDDEYIVFDSYDSDQVSTLTADRVQAMAFVIPTWSVSDSFIPDLPAEAFPALLNEALSTASLKLNQTADQKAEQESSRQNSWLSRKHRRVNNGIRKPDFGRRSRK